MQALSCLRTAFRCARAWRVETTSISVLGRTATTSSLGQQRYRIALPSTSRVSTRLKHTTVGPRTSFDKQRHRGHSNNSKQHNQSESQFSPHLALFTAFTIAAGIGTIPYYGEQSELAPVEKTTDLQQDGVRRIRLADVAKHDGDAAQKWVVCGTKVYDITDFVDSHPGGQVILRACGGSIDPFWKIFTIHQKPEMKQVLDQYHIGDLDIRDVNADGSVDWASLGGRHAANIDDPFSQDPVQDPALIFHTQKPCNAETPAELLDTHFITPLKHFFVRNHLWVPNIEPETHELKIEFADGEEAQYSMEELKTAFKPCTITTTLQCSGNRRSHMSNSERGNTNGLQWDLGAISTATFTGARLSDVLREAGYHGSADESDAHIHFTAPSDTYSASIPLATALAPDSDVLLAYSMNGEPMNRTHGGPLRVIVPGITAARSVKWVGQITISDEEADSQWQRRDYKIFPPDVKAKDVKPEDWDALPSIQETPVQSAITSVKAPSQPAEAEQHDSSIAKVSGFAYSGGGRKILRVEVSPDGGKSWTQARIKEDDAQGSKRWAWSLWEADLVVRHATEGAEQREFVVRAIDEVGNTQPASFEGTWNFRGLLANAWHRVKA